MRHNIGLYRGKQNGNWIEGNLLIDEAGNCYIGTYLKSSKCNSFVAGGGRQSGKTVSRFVGIGFSLVDQKTVGQFTGLTDKNGTKIFEGDIVKVDGMAYEVKYMLGQFFIGINMPIAYKRFDCEVIGNIHDNPDLLEVSK